jgi:hypothetical protein
MLSITYKEVMRASQNQHAIRALFASTSQGATAQRSFTCQQSILRRHSPLRYAYREMVDSTVIESKTILNKQLHYLHSNKVA